MTLIEIMILFVAAIIFIEIVSATIYYGVIILGLYLCFKLIDKLIGGSK